MYGPLPFLWGSSADQGWSPTNPRIYYFDEKYQCLLISYNLILFQQKQEQQQPVTDFENGVIVKIYKS